MGGGQPPEMGQPDQQSGSPMAGSTASTTTETGDPSKQLRKDEDEDATYETGQCEVSSHTRFTTDDVAGAPMDPKLVAKGRQEEMRYFKEMGVYARVSEQECCTQTEKGRIAVRWIDTTKDDTDNPNYRSRLYAATPRRRRIRR